MGTAVSYPSLVPLLAVLSSTAAIPLILLSRRHPNLREFWTIAAAVAKFCLILSLLPGTLAGRNAVIRVLTVFPGVDIALRADPLGVLFALIASGLWILTSFYSIGYVRGAREHKQTRYFASFALCLSATIGVAFAANLLTFVLFYEILTIATYPLVVHKETPVSIDAGRKYLVYTLSAGVFLIAGTLYTYHLCGPLDFTAGGLIPSGVLTARSALALFAFLMLGVGVKAAIMPLHSWLPAAMAAPTPVSALLHAVAVVKSGVFGVIRMVGFVFGPGILRQFSLQQILIPAAAITIIAASLIALKQDNLKRRLAYSTVAHLSYIVLGASLLTPRALTGALAHILFHATMKITLFFAAGAIYVNLHKENISEMNGIGRTMPWTMGAFAVGAVGLAGIPPVNGFISKWYLVWGSLDGGLWVPVAVLVLSGLLNVAYFFPIVYIAFFRKGGKELDRKGEAPLTMVIPLVLTALLSLILGFYPDFPLAFFKLIDRISTGVMGGLS